MKRGFHMVAGAAFSLTLAIASGLMIGVSPALAEIVYNRGAAADPETLDPHKTSTTYEADIMRDLFEGLVMPDSKANLIPGAAESWTISPDGLVYTFKMRADGKWSNGDPVTADDFVYSMRRMVSKDLAAEYASILYPIKNAEEVNGGKVAPEEMGVKALDPMTLEITLKGPTPYFLQMLTHQAAYPVHKGSIEKFGADFVKPGNLVSNGPYMLTEFTPNAKVQIVKNPNFHDAANVKIDVVNYIPTEDRSAAIKRFEAGEFDSYGDLPTEQLADLKAKFGDQIRVAPYLGTYYYAIKTDKKPWDNPELRKALSMAIDRDFLAEKIWANSMIPAYSFVPPGMAGYTPAVADYADACRSSTARMQARAILEEARLHARHQSAQARDPLQHVGEPQEHGGGDPGHAQAAQCRSDDAQHRHQDPLRPPEAEGRFRPGPCRRGLPITRMRRTSCSWPRSNNGNNYSQLQRTRSTTR